VRRGIDSFAAAWEGEAPWQMMHAFIAERRSRKG
jgi:hypothetical protein